MWWEPQNDGERELQGLLYRINDHFLTPSRTIREVVAVGSTRVDGERALLLLLDEALCPERSGSGIAQWLRRTFYPSDLILDILDPWMYPRRLHDEMLTPLRRASERVRGLLAPWDLPDDTQLMFVSWPQPLFGQDRIVPGLRLVCGEKAGTFGIALRCDGKLFGTTAGHVVGAASSAIARPRRGWFRSRPPEIIGTSLCTSDPTSRVGADVALFALEPSARDPALADAGRWRPARLATVPIPDHSDLSLVGGVSGLRRGWAENPLLSTRTLPGESRIWANSWTVVEKGGGLAQRGDSGGIVYNKDNEIVGHLVAAFGVLCRSGRLQCALVQDFHTVLKDAAAKSGLPLQPVVADGVLFNRKGWRTALVDWLTG